MRGLCMAWVLLASVSLAAAGCVPASRELPSSSDEPALSDEGRAGDTGVVAHRAGGHGPGKVKAPSLPRGVTLAAAEALVIGGDFAWSAFHPHLLARTGVVTERGPPVLL